MLVGDLNALYDELWLGQVMGKCGSDTMNNNEMQLFSFLMLNFWPIAIVY